MTDFIDHAHLADLLAGGDPDLGAVEAAIARSLDKQALTVDEAALLVTCRSPRLRERIQQAARDLKRRVYGNRIVLFAPLYIGSHCINDCAYCGFRRSNRDAERSTLAGDGLRSQVAALEDRGHKRLILVFGEHPDYGPEQIAQTVREVYAVRSGAHGEIRRVNVNAAPFDVAGFATVKASGIGTYQVFQETYHRPTYAAQHPAGTRKADYDWRLSAFDRAMEAGIDDVGIGALFGLYDWRFEVLGLVAHARHLQQRFGVGPHTISFPRLQPATGVDLGTGWTVGDDDFAHLVAVLRLAVPYTGLILTAREPAAVRRRVLEFGVSQIDGGTRIDLGGYTCGGGQDLRKAQFRIGDDRSLDEIIGDLAAQGYLPSFCTACYRLGRTGEHFMEFAIPGFIKRFCTPNALCTLQEYLCDYASPPTRAAAEPLLDAEVAALPDPQVRDEVARRLVRIRTAQARDLPF